jgi:hypothetical protein
MELVKQLREDRKQAWKEDAMTAEKIRKADAIADENSMKEADVGLHAPAAWQA